MVGDPVVDRVVVLLRVNDIVVDFLRVVHVSWFVPRAHVNTDRQTVWEKLLRCPEVNVLARRWRVRMEVGMVGSELATEA